jgi:hypothetical protein
VASVVTAEQKADYELQHPDAKVLATNQTVPPPSYGYVLATQAALANPTVAKLILAEREQHDHSARSSYYYRPSGGRAFGADISRPEYTVGSGGRRAA